MKTIKCPPLTHLKKSQSRKAIEIMKSGVVKYEPKITYFCGDAGNFTFLTENLKDTTCTKCKAQAKKELL